MGFETFTLTHLYSILTDLREAATSHPHEHVITYLLQPVKLTKNSQFPRQYYGSLSAQCRNQALGIQQTIERIINRIETQVTRQHRFFGGSLMT